MEIINIEKKTFEEMMSRFEDLSDKINDLCQSTTNKEMDNWLDNQDVCLMLNISPRTLQTYRNTGKISFSQINHKIYYRPSEVEKLLQPDNNNGNSNNSNQPKK